MAYQQPNERDLAITDFKKQLELCTLRTPPPPLTCERSYVRVSKLVQWLESPAVLRGHQTTQASRLLDFAYYNRHTNGRASWPIDRARLFDGQNRCVVIFSILLTMGWGHLVHNFRSMQIGDSNLPIDLYSLKATFQGMVDTNRLPNPHPSPEALAELFNETQWQFCPAKFNQDYEEYFDKSWIIPIHKRAHISEGGTAILWQIEVLEEFVGKKLRESSQSALYTDEQDGLGPRYHFALKVFHDGNRGICDNEKDAFTALRKHDGIVRYLGGYSHQIYHHPAPDSVQTLAAGRKYTHNILLEYGDRDLALLFAEKLPPVLQDDIKSFWQSLFAVADAVKGIHQFEVNNDGIIQEYLGWHSDIKPENILEIQGEFKLADPGFAKFLEKVKRSDSDPMANLSGGTHTFGAPERYPGRKNRGAVNQTTDIWSLGCVFSIAATWVALGAEGIKQYLKLRQKAIDNLVRIQDPGDTAPLKLDRGDYFHNGFNVLKEVTMWHTYLRSSLRVTDSITSTILDLVDKHMLVGDPKSRMKSPKVCTELENIIVNLKPVSNTIPDDVLDSIMDSLAERDEGMIAGPSSYGHSPARTVTSNTKILDTPNVRRDRKDKFNQFLGAPLMGIYRSYAKSTPDRPSFAAQPQPQDPGSNEVLILNTTVPANRRTTLAQESQTYDFPPSPVTIRPGSMMRTGTGITDSTTRRPPPKKSHPQDVFQARDAMELLEAERRDRSIMPSMLSKKLHAKPKDETLDSYWKDRDLKFLVDNAETMIPHWGQVKFLLETLLRKAEGLDPDGVDLTFTLSNVKIENSKDRVEKIMKKVQNPSARPKLGLYTDMANSLQDIFDQYFRTSQTASGAKAKLTILILTDGIWEGNPQKDHVNDAIIAFAQKLEKKFGRIPKDRPVSIEFVQFGKDPEATFRLRRLDDELQHDGIPDFIDTEHCTGDVNKMLLGSFVPAYDEMETEYDATNSGPTSPSRQSTYSTYTQFQSQGPWQNHGPPPRSMTFQANSGNDPVAQDMRPAADTLHQRFPQSE